MTALRSVSIASRCSAEETRQRTSQCDAAPEKSAGRRKPSIKKGSSMVRRRPTDPPKRLSDEERLEIAENLDVSLAYVVDCEQTCFDWALSNGKQKVNWLATVRNWIRREKQRRPGGVGPEKRQHSLPFGRHGEMVRDTPEEIEAAAKKFREETAHLRRRKRNEENR